MNFLHMKKNLKVYVLIGFGLAGLILAYYLDSRPSSKITTTNSNFNVTKQTPETVYKEAVPQTNPDLSEIEQQQQAEQDFFITMQEIQKNYPWYSKLPLETKDYLIIYDWDKKKFLISVKYPASSPNVKTAQDSALLGLRNIGVDPDKWGYYIVTQ